MPRSHDTVLWLANDGHDTRPLQAYLGHRKIACTARLAGSVARALSANGLARCATRVAQRIGAALLKGFKGSSKKPAAETWNTHPHRANHGTDQVRVILGRYHTAALSRLSEAPQMEA